MTRVTTVLLLASLCAWPRLATAQRLDRYVETVTLDADGNGRVEVEVALGAGSVAPFQMPVVLGRPTDVTVRGHAGAAALLTNAEGRAGIQVEPGEATPDGVVLRVTYRVGGVIDVASRPLAHGNRRVRYLFVNTIGPTIERFEATLVLPPDVIVSSVDEVVPEPSDSSMEQPVVLSAQEDRTVVTIHAGGVANGGRAGVTLRVKPLSSRVPLLLVLVSLGGAYLFRFRDLARRRPAVGPGT